MNIKKTLILAVPILIAAGCSKNNANQMEDTVIVYPTAAAITTSMGFVGGNDYTDGILLFGESRNEVENGTSNYIEIYDGNDPQTLNLTGLNPTSEYYYRTRVIKNGDIEYGPIKSFITPEPIFIDAGVTGKGVNYLDFSLSCSDPLNYAIISFGVQYATSYSGVFAGEKKTSKSSSIRIENLKSSTKYYYRSFVVVSYPEINVTDYIYGPISEAETDKALFLFNLTSYSSYPWIKSTARGTNGLRSSNSYINSSISSSYLNIYLDKKCTVSFNYAVSSETSYDTFSIKVDNTTIVNAISGSKSGTLESEMSPGEHSIYLSYSKDSRDNAGNDEACIYNIKVDGVYISNADITEY